MEYQFYKGKTILGLSFAMPTIKSTMKKNLLVGCAMLITLSCAYGQIKKGNLQFGGSLGYSHDRQDQSSIGQTLNSSNTFWSFLPSIGYFVTETSSLGIGIGYDRFDQVSKSRTPNVFLIGQPTTLYAYENTNTGEQFIVKPYYRMHKILSQNFVLFAEFNAFYGFGSRERTINSTATEIATNGSITSQTFSSTKLSEKQNTWGIGLSPGIIFFPHEKWGIDLSIGLLRYSEVLGEQSNSSSNLTLQPSFNNLSLGLKYYITK
jgi:hypothetical protein